MLFCYCAVEQTAGLWASSYLTLYKGVSADTAASFASMFFIGITIGRALSGFITMKLNDVQMIRMGQLIIGLGVITMILPLGQNASLVGLIMILGFHIQETKEELRKLGFSQFCTFAKMQPIYHKL